MVDIGPCRDPMIRNDVEGTQACDRSIFTYAEDSNSDDTRSQLRRQRDSEDPGRTESNPP